MIRKAQYEVVAKSLNKSVTRMRREGNVEGLNMLADVISDMLFAFKKSNPLFKRQRFVDACFRDVPALAVGKLHIRGLDGDD